MSATEDIEEIPTPIVISTTLALESLCAERPMDFYQFVMSCRDRAYELLGSPSVLLDRGLIEGIDASGTPIIHEAIRSVTGLSVAGDDLAMRIVPYGQGDGVAAVPEANVSLRLPDEAWAQMTPDERRRWLTTPAREVMPQTQ